MPPGIDLEAEVPPGATGASGGDKIILRCGASTSSPLCLPVRVVPGKQVVRVQSGHYEIKLATCAGDAQSQSTSANDIPALLDASRLSDLAATSFICASCSLPLVQSSPSLRYQDLPSEYWSELLDAWMCHSDQKLHQQVARHGQGFWPQRGQALVGGSYVLFDETAVVQTNTRNSNASKVCLLPLSFLYIGRQEGRRWVFTSGRRLACRCPCVGRAKPLTGFARACCALSTVRASPSVCFRLIPIVQY